MVSVRNRSNDPKGSDVMKVAYLGPKGSFSNLAATYLLPQAESIPYDSLEQIMTSSADYLLVPVENSLEGSVLPLVDLILQNCPPIQAELVLPIKQQLLVQPKFKAQWQQAVKIYSHHQALAQAQPFINQYLPKIQQVPTPSTTVGVQQVVQQPQEILLAVGSTAAAAEYGLAIAQKNIQTNDANATRFWLLGTHAYQPELPVRQNKASLIIDLKQDQPGALHQILAIFAQHKINLTKIESRPKKTRLGEYYFLIDAELPFDPVPFTACLKRFDQQQVIYRFLGSYQLYSPDSSIVG